MTYKILFVCKHNRFRSKIASAYFRKINRNKKIIVYDAGIIRGIPVARTVIKICKKFGITLNSNPNPIKEELLKQIDLVVIVANNVPASIFKGRVEKIIVWKIPDSRQSDEKKIGRIVKKIMNKVDKLNRKLEKKRWDQ